MTQKYIKKEEPCEDRGRDWIDASSNHGIQRIASNPKKLGNRHGKYFPSELPRMNQPC